MIGWDEFRVQAPMRGHAMRVILRTMLDATCTVVRTSEKFAEEGLHLRSPIQIRPIVNGETLPVVSLAVTGGPGAFAECVFDIPAECITTDPVEIALAGDHIALAYWFYQ